MEDIKENINKALKPGHKQTKLGWIPMDWEVLPLCNATKLLTNGFVGKATDHYTEHDGITYIQGFNVEENGFNLKGIKKVTKEFHDKNSKSCLIRGDLLTIQTGEIGLTTLVPPELEGANCHALIISRFKDGFDPEFYVQYYNSYIGRHSMRRIETGSTMKHLNVKDMRDWLIPIPPLIEQQKIAQILSTWDKAIEKTEQLIQTKTQLKKGLMQQLLTGKKRFEEFVISHDYVITRVGLIPKDWIVIPFSEVADKKVKWSLTGGPFGSNLKAEDFTEEGVRIVQLQNIGDGEFYNDYKIFTSEEKADELLSCNIFPGDIILSKMGDPVARACFIPKTRERFLMASDGIRLVPDKQLFDNLFVKEYINYKAFRRAAIRASTGSTRQRIGLTDLKELPFIKLKLKEQQKISSMLSVANEEINLLKSQLKKLISQKRGLMQKLLTGEIRVKTK